MLKKSFRGIELCFSPNVTVEGTKLCVQYRDHALQVRCGCFSSKIFFHEKVIECCIKCDNVSMGALQVLQEHRQTLAGCRWPVSHWTV